MEAIGIIALGTYTKNSTFINMGLILFVVGIVTRYVDTLWGLLGGSIGFIVGGLILIGGGYLIAKKRKKLLESIKNENYQ